MVRIVIEKITDIYSNIILKRLNLIKRLGNLVVGVVHPNAPAAVSPPNAAPAIIAPAPVVIDSSLFFV
jgi:hypothetical protein